MLQSPEAKFRIRQSEVASAGLFSDIELFKAQVGPTAKPSAHDKWLESTAALTKAVAACTKAATQKLGPKKPAAPKPSTSGTNNKKSTGGNKTPGGGRKRGTRSKTTRAKKATKPSTAANAAASTTKKATEEKPSAD